MKVQQVSLNKLLVSRTRKPLVNQWRQEELASIVFNEGRFFGAIVPYSVWLNSPLLRKDGVGIGAKRLQIREVFFLLGQSSFSPDSLWREYGEVIRLGYQKNDSVAMLIHARHTQRLGLEWFDLNYLRGGAA